MTYRPDIDGVRGLAVLAVVVFHAHEPLLPGGYLGVDVFFVISGYLITTILMSDLEQGRRPFARFYERRLRRIVPALVVVLLASTVAAWFLMPSTQMHDYAKSLVMASGFASNLWLWRHTGYFDVGAAERPLLHTWSLGVEEQFYLLYPVLLVLSHRWGPRALRATVGVGLLGSYALFVVQSGIRPEATFYLLPTRAWQLLAGAALALVGARVMDRLGPSRAGWLQGVALLGLLLLLLSAVADPLARHAPLVQTLAVLAAVVLLAPASRPSVVASLLATRGLVAIGMISYSAYLWHQPLFAFVRMGYPHPLGPLALAGLVLLTGLLAAASWRWVEQPLRHAVAPSRGHVWALSLASLGVLAAIGVALHESRALNAYRLGPHVLALEARLQEQWEARQTETRVGHCSFNGVFGHHRRFEPFLAEWDCWGGGTERTLVMGDSHADDMAMMLRQLGLDVGQMTGAGCSLVPSLMGPWCRAQFDQVRSRAAEMRVVRLVLANRFQTHELSPDALREMQAYWSWRGVEVWLFTGMPETRDLMLQRVRAEMLSQHIEHITVDPQTVLASEAAAQVLARQWPGLTVFNRRELFCSISPEAPCSWLRDGKALILDGHHLTPEGAIWLGRQLMQRHGDRIRPLIEAQTAVTR